MKATKAAGTRREHDVRNWLVKDGWVVYRGAASLGAADLIALRAGQIKLVQVKANKGNAFMNFRKPERQSLAAEAAVAGAEAILVHWPPNGSQTRYSASEWPK